MPFIPTIAPNSSCIVILDGHDWVGLQHVMGESFLEGSKNVTSLPES